MMVNIGPVIRRDDLPHSVSPGRTATVQVTVDPPLDGGAIAFEVVADSPDSGSATIVGNPQLSEGGFIEIRGDQQTAPGDANELRIRALLDGEQIAESPPFSVCAHPTAVSYEYLGEVDDDLHRFGIRLTVIVDSDSGNNLDLDEVEEKEIVSEDHGHSDSLIGLPPDSPEQDKKFHRALHVPPDRHTAGRITTRSRDHHRLHGVDGSWSNDQLDVFLCKRCGSNPDGSLILHSGYRLTRTIFTEDGQLKVRFLKVQYPTALGDLHAEPGPTPAIQRVVDAPTLEGPIPPIDTGPGEDVLEEWLL